MWQAFVPTLAFFATYQIHLVVNGQRLNSNIASGHTDYSLLRSSAIVKAISWIFFDCIVPANWPRLIKWYQNWPKISLPLWFRWHRLPIWRFSKNGHSRPLFLSLFSSFQQLTVNMIIIKFSQWLDWNCGLLALEVDRSANWATTTAPIWRFCIFNRPFRTSNEKYKIKNVKNVFFVRLILARTC